MRKKAVYTINSDDGIPICCVCKLQIGEGDDNCLNCALYESEQEIERIESVKERAINLVTAEAKLKQVIGKATERGELIMRYGDLPEYKPYDDALNSWIDVAKDAARL
jgi:hypothetical protein